MKLNFNSRSEAKSINFQNSKNTLSMNSSFLSSHMQMITKAAILAIIPTIILIVLVNL
jgi:hypothetical protein